MINTRVIKAEIIKHRVKKSNPEDSLFFLNQGGMKMSRELYKALCLCKFIWWVIT